MAVNPKIIKDAVLLATDNRVWKAIGTVFAVFAGIILVVLLIIASVLSGLFSLLSDWDAGHKWLTLRKNVEEAFSVIGDQISQNVKKQVYDFMPDFSVNLNKFVISKNFDGSFLLLYDTRELQTVYNNLSASFENMDSEAQKRELSGIKDKYLPKQDYQYSEGIDDLTEKSYRIQTLIVETPKSDTTGEYVEVQIVEYTCYGETSLDLPRFMALYNARQIQDNFSDDENIDPDKFDEDAQAIYDKLEEEDIVVSDENGNVIVSDDADTNIWNGIRGAFDSNALFLNAFERGSFMQIINNAIEDGRVLVDVSISDIEYSVRNDGRQARTQKLEIVLDTPTDEEWFEIFGVSEEYSDTVDDYERIINEILDKAVNGSIPQSQRVLDLDMFVQQALFVYFEGFFNLPVERESLRAGTNGIYCNYGYANGYHRGNARQYIPLSGGMTTNAEEFGITLMLKQYELIEVKAGILPDNGCITQFYCYNYINIVKEDSIDSNDVQRSDDGNYVYNRPAITFAYVIDTEMFKETYGFDFPVIYGVKGDRWSGSEENDTVCIEPIDGKITMFVEYGCFDNFYTPFVRFLNSQRRRGTEIIDVKNYENYDGGAYWNNGNFIIGYAYYDSWEGDSKYETGSYVHRVNDIAYNAHLSIRTAFKGGEIKPEDGRLTPRTNPLRSDIFYYPLEPFSPLYPTNVSESEGYIADDFFRMYGVLVNPRLWFKSFRTELNDMDARLLDTLVSVDTQLSKEDEEETPVSGGGTPTGSYGGRNSSSDFYRR
jgi:hypothetical protein